ncbi:class D sortase [Bacillus sonorensis]|uniref:class D sortase n=1 Tax=Bacillus sonorensis TaxID=119858 RepID=UPI002282E845|nr:class D sortase [Bacillus sonorensis]MCY7855967.1 class D sortase [Bacillus sonorensis]MCY8271507.1 class D sortase [Bacillus sonorensis]MCY8405562.1 class D sortase [Bacillus sonorensis]MCY8604043.1 class D sortase [Bacillus sonorensis]
MKMKFFSILLMAAGFLIIVYGGWKIYDMNRQTGDSLTEAKKAVAIDGKSDTSAESFQPVTGEAVGILYIPRLKAELPIVEGTSADDLAKGVGHYKGSYYPEQNGQIVLSGHRDTVFRRTGELELGDKLQIELPYGRFAYKIVKTKIVDQDDTSIITLQNKKEELILTTCYPFSYVGNAPQRYIIYAEPL